MFIIFPNCPVLLLVHRVPAQLRVPSDVSESLPECRCVQKRDEGEVLFLVLLRRSAAAEKNNPKRSTILQHLLTGPHQQMLQNSSALEIKEVAWSRCAGWGSLDIEAGRAAGRTEGRQMHAAYQSHVHKHTQKHAHIRTLNLSSNSLEAHCGVKNDHKTTLICRFLCRPLINYFLP